MDDASRLIGDLQLKLAQLDDKVSAYRQDMAAEFERYSRHLLQDIPEHLSAEVERRVQESFARYPAIGPELQRLADSPPPSAAGATAAAHADDNLEHLQDTAGTGSTNPPAARPRRSSGSPPPPFDLPSHLSSATDSPSPIASPTRDRDAELQGVFTPSYLPLFDSAQPVPRSPASPAQQPPAAAQAMGNNDGGKVSAKDQLPSASRASLSPPRPHHHRRSTNETTSSGNSEVSESKMPRSALRRSSSGSKPPPSPRRVRFEFEGHEVLPTSSPQTSEVSLVQSHSLHSSSVLPVDPTLADEGDNPISAEALLGPDEDSTPPPKKVSSSQALRALSRTPLDANTIWTVVNAESPEPSSGTNSPRTLTSPSPSKTSLPESPLRPAQPPAQSPQRAKKTLKSPPPEPQAELDEDGDDDSSDDDFLAMAKPKSFANKKAILSPVIRSPPPVQASVDSKEAAPAAKATTEEAEHDEEEDFFHFEGGSPSKPRPTRPEPIEEDEEIEEPAETNLIPPDGPTLYSTSPAVTMPKSEPPLAHHLTSGSVGSYRGRSVHMPIVKDPAVYAQAASLGDISSFIGGVDGRSGADAGDLASYRASVGHQVLFSGTPRSLTERMMMEEAMAQRRAAAPGPQP